MSDKKMSEYRNDRKMIYNHILDVQLAGLDEFVSNINVPFDVWMLKVKYVLYCTDDTDVKNNEKYSTIVTSTLVNDKIFHITDNATYYEGATFTWKQPQSFRGDYSFKLRPINDADYLRNGELTVCLEFHEY
jgi:hypothetical protein